MLKKNTYQTILLYPSKLSFYIKGKIKNDQIKNIKHSAQEGFH